jgi:hypothetical protein
MLSKPITSDRIYGCLAILEGLTKEVFWRPIRANSKESAEEKFIASPEVAKFLLIGYQITAWASIELGSGFVPFNSGSDFCVLTDPNGKNEAVYIRVDGDYSTEFRNDLQAFVSKYCPSLPCIFEK